MPQSVIPAFVFYVHHMREVARFVDIPETIFNVPHQQQSERLYTSVSYPVAQARGVCVYNVFQPDVQSISSFISCDQRL